MRFLQHNPQPCPKCLISGLAVLGQQGMGLASLTGLAAIEGYREGLFRLELEGLARLCALYHRPDMACRYAGLSATKQLPAVAARPAAIPPRQSEIKSRADGPASTCAFRK